MTPEEFKALKREARKKGTPATRLLQLAALDSELALAVAKNKAAPISVLETLAEHPEVPVRCAVAQHPQLSVRLLVQLAGDPAWKVAKAVAQHPQTPQDTLKLLAHHPQALVRAAVVARQPAPLALIKQLACSGLVAERLTAAGAPALSPQLVNQLSRDPQPKVKLKLLRTHPQMLPPETVLEYVQQDDYDLKVEAVSYLQDPVWLEQLSESDRPDIRLRVMGNSCTPVSVLERCAKQNLDELDPMIAQALISNQALPQELHHELRKQMNRPLKYLAQAELYFKEPSE